ncbi:recombinase family protein [Chloroflexota bacterium]
MKAAIYCRVSTEDQEREGSSLGTQAEACLKYCQDKGYDVAYQISETYSGLGLERPKLDELRELVRSNAIDVPVVYCLDRLSRDPTHGVILTEELQKHGVRLEAVIEDVDNSDLGKLISYIRGFAAKLEAEKIRERTIRGKKERVRAGRLPGGRFSKLYGYDYLPGKGEGEGVRYKKDSEASVVKEIYRLYIEDGLSLCKITERLNKLGIPAPSGKNPWNRTGVHYVLKNPAYTGKTLLFTRFKTEARRHLKASRKSKLTHMGMRPRGDWIEAEAATPPIISEGLFNQVQLKLKRNKELASRNAKRQYLLSGYVFCETCGRRYLARKNTNGRSYYKCPRCKGIGLNADRIESSVWGRIEEAMSKPEVVLVGIEMRQNEQNNEEEYHKQLEGTEVQLRHLEKEKDRAWKAFELTGDETKFATEVKNIMSRIDQLKRQEADLQSALVQIEDTEVDIEAIRQYCETMRHNLADLSFSDKRGLLEALRIRVLANQDSIPKLDGTLPIVSGQCALSGVSSPYSLAHGLCFQLRG